MSPLTIRPAGPEDAAALALAPQSHALYPGGREVLWVKDLAAIP